MKTKVFILSCIVLLTNGLCSCGMFVISGVIPPPKAEKGDLESIEDDGIIVDTHNCWVWNAQTGKFIRNLTLGRNRRLGESICVDAVRGRSWVAPRSCFTTTEAFSFGNVVVERYTFSKYKNTGIFSVNVLGAISDELLVLEVVTDDKLPAGKSILRCCLYNRYTDELSEEIANCNYEAGRNYNPYFYVEDGKIYYSDISRIKHIYDLGQKKWRDASTYKKIAEVIDENGNLSGNRLDEVWPGDLQEDAFEVTEDNSTRSSEYQNGPLADYLRIWVWDSLEKKYVKNPNPEYSVYFPEYHWTKSPDGKRILLHRDGCPYIYDMSTGLVAQVPNFDCGILQGSSGATWSPSGRYVTIDLFTRCDRIGEPVIDRYVLEVITGKFKLLKEDPEPGTLWLAPPHSRRLLNIIYAEWLITILEHGAAEKKICARLQEFLSVSETIKPKDWRAWLEMNKDYFVWSEKDQRLFVYEQAKTAAVSVDIWSIIPEAKRLEWNKLSDDEKKIARDKAQVELNVEAKLIKSAWYAGIDLDVWRRVPSEVRDKWESIKDEERMEEMAKAKKEYLSEKKGE